MALVGTLGAAPFLVYGFLPFVAFFGVIAFTGVAAPAGGKRYVGRRSS